MPVPEQASGVFAGVVTALLLCMLERIPALSEYYLTISWSALGVALFCVALAFGQKYYRYAGLLVILFASIRVVAVDTRELEPMPRVLAWAVLGGVLLALGFGYVKAVARSAPAAGIVEEPPPE